MGELGEQRCLAHPRFPAHHDAPQAGLFHQSQLRPEDLQLDGAADERDAVRQICRQRYVNGPDRRRCLGGRIDAVPPGGHPTFDPDDLGRGLGTELFDQERSVGLKGPQGVGLATS